MPAAASDICFCMDVLTIVQNIRKAKAEIARLEEEYQQRASGASKKGAQASGDVNGNATTESEAKQENDAAADAAEQLQKASLEDKQ